jgi:hypothetical protein
MSKEEKVFVPRICFACHGEIHGYYRTWRNRKERTERYKCAACLLYADLDWRDKAIADLQRERPEFAVVPADKVDIGELLKMCIKSMGGKPTPQMEARHQKEFTHWQSNETRRRELERGLKQAVKAEILPPLTPEQIEAA